MADESVTGRGNQEHARAGYPWDALLAFPGRPPASQPTSPQAERKITKSSLRGPPTLVS